MRTRITQKQRNDQADIIHVAQKGDKNRKLNSAIEKSNIADSTEHVSKPPTTTPAKPELLSIYHYLDTSSMSTCIHQLQKYRVHPTNMNAKSNSN